MQEPMSNISREMEILIKSQKEMLEIKNTIQEMKNAKMPLMGSSVEWTQPSKELVGLKICQKKLPKPKCRGGKKRLEKWGRIFKS